MNMANDTVLNLQELANIARTRAAFYSFLNVHFTMLPDVPFVERFRNGDLIVMLEALVNDDAVETDIATGAAMMRAYLDQTRIQEASELAQSLGVDRTRLYRGLSPTYGPPPPYEMVWSKTGQDVKLLVTLAGIYREMGLGPSADLIERMDYIGVELDYLRELALHEAAAWESNASESAAKLIEAQRTFLHEHLASWVPFFIDKALEQAETDFYKGHLRMLRGFIASEQDELASLVEETSLLHAAIPVA